MKTVKGALCTLGFLLACAAAPAFAQSSEALVNEIRITAKRYEFVPNKITVHKGEKVRLIVTSQDVDHGFAIDALKIEKKISAHSHETIEFTPTKEGKFQFYCSDFCGDGHDKMKGELIVTKGQATPAKMQVSFDPNSPGVVIVESPSGEKLRIDTNAKTVAALAETPAEKHDETHEAAARDKREAEKQARGTDNETFDYKLINLPTPKRVPRHSINVEFTHRFAEPLRSLEGEREEEHASRISNDLLGLDSLSVSSFGLTYGVTDRLYVRAYRSPISTKGLSKTIELGAGFHLLDEAGRSPVEMQLYGSIEGDRNFTETYTENIQLMVSRSVTEYAHVFFSPAVHINSNGQGRFNPRPEDFFPFDPTVAAFKLGQHTGSFGFGVDAKIRPSVALMFEFTPRVGFKMGRVDPIFDSKFNRIGLVNESEPEIGFGIQKRIGRHVFALTFSNTQATTTARYNSSNLVLSPSNWTIGFNLFRRLK